MKKRLLSLLMALAVSATLMPSGVMAEETLTIEGFNATKSAITIDLADTASADADLSTITVYKLADGTMDDVTYTVTTTETQTVTETVTETTTDEDGNETTTDTTVETVTAEGNTVIIEPDEGIDTDAFYKVAIGGTTTGWFKVNQVFFDDFEPGEVTAPSTDEEGNAVAGTATNPYYWHTDNKLYTSYWTAEHTGGSRFMPGSYNASGKAYSNFGTLMCTNNGGHTTLTDEALAAFPELVDIEDYTIEYDYKLPNSKYSRGEAAVRMRASTKSTGYAAVLHGSDTSFYKDQLTGKISLRAGTTELVSIPSYTVASDELKIRMSTVGNEIQYYIDNDKLFDVTDNTITTGGKMWFVDSALCGEYYSPSTYDNVSITTVTKYGDFELSVGAIEYKDFNATKSAITADFSNVNAGFDAASLDGKISLIKKASLLSPDEEAITDFEITVTSNQAGADASGNAINTALGNTIVITPASGLEAGAIYKLSFDAGLTDLFGNSMAEAATTGWFKVNQVFFDDFEPGDVTAPVGDGTTTTTEGTATYPYYWDTTNYTNYRLHTEWWTNGLDGDGGSRFMPGSFIGNATTVNTYGALICVNNGGNTTLTDEALAAFPELVDIKDYTIEYNYQMQDKYVNNGKAAVRMRASSSSTGYAGVLVGNTTDAFFGSNLSGEILLQAGTTSLASIPSYTVASSAIKVRMSTIDDQIQYYIDDAKLFDITDSTITTGGKMWFTDTSGSGSWYKPATYDNVSITTVTKYGDIDVSNTPLVYEGFNATKSVITVDYTDVFEAIDATNLTDKITISKMTDDGTTQVTDFTATVTTEQTGTDANGKTIATSRADTIIITPAGGIDTTAKYRVVVNGIADSLGRTADAVDTGWFKVTEIFAEDFNASEYANEDGTYNEPYTYYPNEEKPENSYLTSSYWSTGDSSTSYSTKNTIKDDMFKISNNSGTGLYLNETGLPSSKRVADYTIEATVGLPQGFGNGYTQVGDLKVGVSIRNALSSYASWAALNAKQGYNFFYGYNTVTFGMDGTATQTISTGDNYGKTVNVRMSAIGNNIQAYADDDRLFDVTDDTINRVGGIGYSGGSAWGLSPGYSSLDNVSITKVETFEGLEDVGESIVYEGFNATKSVITVDYTDVYKTIDTDGLEDKITLLQKEFGSMTEEEVTDYTATVSTDTIIITPANGIDTNKQYRVKVAGITDAIGRTGDDADTGWFKVTELFADDFEAAAHIDDEDTPYSAVLNEDGTVNYYTSSDWKVGIYDSSWGHVLINADGKLQMHNNDLGAYVTTAAFADRVRDYTVEADFTLPTNIYNDMGISIRNYFASGKYGNGYNHIQKNDRTGYGLAFGEGGSGLKLTSGYENATDSTKTLGVIDEVEFTPEKNGTYHLRLSAIENNIQGYVDDKKYFDVIDTTNEREDGGFGVWGYSYNTSSCKPIYVDNVSLTKVEAIEVPETVEIVAYNADTEGVYLTLGDLGITGNIVTATDGVTLKDKTGATVAAEVTAEDNRIIIVPENDLNCNEKYTVSVTDAFTGYGTLVNDYTKDFQIVKVWEETFDTKDTVIQDTDDSGWSTIWSAAISATAGDLTGVTNQNLAASAYSWDEANQRMKIQTKTLPKATSSDGATSSTSYALDRLTPRSYPNSKKYEYTTKFDLTVYKAVNNFKFYSNKTGTMKSVYDSGVNYSFNGTDLQVRTFGTGGSVLQTTTLSNWGVAGETYTVKDMKCNGTGYVTINGKQQAEYDYSGYTLPGGYAGFAVGADSEIGIDNILITYAADWVTGEGAEKDAIAMTDAKAIISDDGSEITATANIVCNENIGGYIVIAAAYANGKLLNVGTKAVSSYSLGVATETNISLADVTGATTVKIMVWDSLKNMKPLLNAVPLTPVTATTIYVSTEAGEGTADGSLENPYTEISEAFAAVQTLSAEADEKKNYIISLEEGEYLLDEVITLNGDSGYDNVASVTLDGNGSAIKTGFTVDSSAFTQVKDTEITSRVPSAAQNYIYAADIGANLEGVEVSINGVIMQSAKYPNDGYLKTADASGQSFEADRASGWNTATDMKVYYMPNYMSYTYSATADGTTVTLNTTNTVESGKEYFVFNLLEELDASGEYFYDKESGMLYTYTQPSKTVEVFTSQSGLMKVSNFANLTIDGITFENASGTLVTLANCTDTVIKNSTFRNGSENAVRILGTEGKNTGLYNCEIYAMGKGGVTLGSGNRQALTPSGDYITNCSIHDCQRLDRSYTALVSMSGVGNKITNSDIYNSYHTAITIYGNDLEIKDNKIYNVCTETSDMGAIYAEGDWTLRGTVIEHNLIENVPAKGSLGAFAIYLDNGLSGTTVKNNIFKNIARQAVYVNGGRDNTVTNNIFIASGNNGAVSDILNWGTGEPSEKMLTNLNAVEYNTDTYAKYEHLADILTDDPCVPKYNKFTKNVLIETNDLATAWLRKTTKDELVSAYGCEFSAYECDYSDLNDYANDDYTLSADTAADIGFETFENSFGRK